MPSFKTWLSEKKRSAFSSDKNMVERLFSDGQVLKDGTSFKSFIYKHNQPGKMKRSIRNSFRVPRKAKARSATLSNLTIKYLNANDTLDTMGKKEDKNRLKKAFQSLQLNAVHLYDRACEFDVFVDNHHLPFDGIEEIGADFVSYCSTDGHHFRIIIREKGIGWEFV